MDMATGPIEFVRVHKMVGEALLLLRLPFAAKQVRPVEALIKDLFAFFVDDPDRQRMAVGDTTEDLGAVEMCDLGQLHFGDVGADQRDAGAKTGVARQQFPAAVDGLRLDRRHVRLPPAQRGAPNEVIGLFHNKTVEAGKLTKHPGDRCEDIHRRLLTARLDNAAENLGIGVDKHVVAVEKRVARPNIHRRIASSHDRLLNPERGHITAA
ncbi:hypothetical protein [Aminobacter ciceronei]|uniref:hypothetical protein n=1 Tax=Aminobacter ciceronei TaxID=150723 RepID=UPI003F6F8670